MLGHLLVPQVAARAVEALMRGDRTVITGWQNKLYVHVLAPLVSGRHAAVGLEYIFWPFNRQPASNAVAREIRSSTN